MNDFELLRPAAVFATVVEEGSFRAAADRLGLSAPYVSQLILDLETRLGCQLLYRSTRKLVLSSDGDRFLPVARQIADALSFGLANFRAETAELVGKLRLGVPTILAEPFFAKVIAEFQTTHPRLEIEIALDDSLTDPLDTQTDLSIRIGFPRHDMRNARKLFETRGIICCSFDMAAQIQAPEDLASFRWIRTPAMPKELIVKNVISGSKTSILCETKLTTNNAQMTSRLISQNLGWAVFPEFAVRDAISDGRMVRVLQSWCLPNICVFGLYSARRRSLSNAKTFMDFVQRKLEKQT